MKFEPGKVIEEFEVDGRKVVFRYPKKGDVDGLLEYINDLIRDKACIAKQKSATKQEESKWLRESIGQLRKGEKVHVIVELDGEIAGSAEVKRKHMDSCRHVGEIAIGLSREAQDRGVGTRLLKTLIEQSKLINIKIIELTVFGPNDRAKHVYEKAGFKYVGKIPNGVNHYGKYCDHMIYYMEVPK